MTFEVAPSLRRLRAMAIGFTLLAPMPALAGTWGETWKQFSWGRVATIPALPTEGLVALALLLMTAPLVIRWVRRARETRALMQQRVDHHERT